MAAIKASLFNQSKWAITVVFQEQKEVKSRALQRANCVRPIQFPRNVRATAQDGREKEIDIICMDSRKALDFIQHDSLINKLGKSGLDHS